MRSAKSVARRVEDLAERLPASRSALDQIGLADEALLRKMQTALGLRWAGAIPTDEPVNATFALPPASERYNVIAADGSQIYPDRHGVALYYLINVGSIIFRAGVARPPASPAAPRSSTPTPICTTKTAARSRKVDD